MFDLGLSHVLPCVRLTYEDSHWLFVFEDGSLARINMATEQFI